MNDNTPTAVPSTRPATLQELQPIRLKSGLVIKPGWRTTEFWLVLASSLVAIVNAAFGWDIPVEAVLTAAGVIASYVISRGLAKRASSLALILIPALALLSGCGVPANKFKLGPYTIATPKNVHIEDFKANLQTNGAIVIEFKRWTSTNDAVVIDKAAAGDAARLNATANLVEKISNAAK